MMNIQNTEKEILEADLIKNLKKIKKKEADLTKNLKKKKLQKNKRIFLQGKLVKKEEL
jgi:hypothetical protein